MILTCPECGARFTINPAALGTAGRTVRCGSCQHAWHQRPEAVTLPIPPAESPTPRADPAPPPAEPDPEPPALATPAAPAPNVPATVAAAPEDPGLARLQAFDAARLRKDREAEFVGERRQRVPLAAVGWLALLVFIGAVGGAGWFGREAIVAEVPEAVSLYRMAGIEVPLPPLVGEGLELRDFNSTRHNVDGQRTLLIQGSVVNISDQAKAVPALLAIITDAEGAEISQWTFTADLADLPPGETTTFKTSAEDPAVDVNISLFFVDRES